jgi:hypothetical protein
MSYLKLLIEIEDNAMVSQRPPFQIGRISVVMSVISYFSGIGDEW